MKHKGFAVIETVWPEHNRVMALLNIRLPIVQAPMAGSDSPQLAAAVSEAGGLGSLACATLSLQQIRQAVVDIRSLTKKPFNLNFFCHQSPEADEVAERRWMSKLAPYYTELGIDPNASFPFANRAPFDDSFCTLLEELRPPVVSFHFGLPAPALVARLKAAGSVLLSSATTVAEAVWLEKNAADAVIAQGFEAGGHRGMFLTTDPAAQVGTMALVPQIADAINIPVIAAGGIGDGRGVAAAFMLGADAVQLGTAYLFCPEARPNTRHRLALNGVRDDNTVLTNVFTGRPARGLVSRLVRDIGPLAEAPAFPLASKAIAPLRTAAEAHGDDDFTHVWGGQAARLAAHLPAGALTRTLAADALDRLRCGSFTGAAND